MKLQLLFVALIFQFNLTAQGTAIASNQIVSVNPYNHIPSFPDEVLKSRVMQMTSSIVIPKFNAQVKSYIKTYSEKRRDKTEKMLGKMEMYFPMFEKYAAELGVPQDLKHLSIVESALNPNAVSRSGAVGLWQFMPVTGEASGLRINTYIDDRKDPHKSTKAALKYLQKQFDRFGSWELALAAYNGGGGRVNRAVKRGRSKNFWKIRKYLPKETRNYVPAFIGASYIAKYYHLHGLAPSYVSHQLQNTALTKVYQEYTFHKLSEITGTPYDIILELNPSYNRSYIPGNRNGNNLVLPQRDMAIFLNYVGRPDSRLNQLLSSQVFVDDANSDIITENYRVQSGEELNTIAKKYNCKTTDLMSWNNLNSSTVRPGQNLVIFIPKRPTSLIQYQAIKSIKSLKYEAKSDWTNTLVMPKLEIPQIENIGKYASIQPKNKGKFIFHKIKKRESILDIANNYPGISINDLIELNGFNNYSIIKPGMKIRIKKK